MTFNPRPTPLLSALQHAQALREAQADYEEWGVPDQIRPQGLPPFPAYMMPAPLNEFLSQVAIAYQTDTALPGTVALGCVAACIARRVAIKAMASWIEPSNLFTLVAMPSGERKSPVYALLTSPLRSWEADAVASHRAIALRHESERKSLEQRRDALIKAVSSKKGGSAQDEARELDRVEAEISAQPPLLSPRLLAEDATPEALVKLLCETGGRLAVMSDEGGIFDTVAGRYSAGMPNWDAILKGYSGQSIYVDRVGRGAQVIQSPALTMGLTVQPEVLGGLASKPGARERGFLSRWLYALPPSLVGRREILTEPPHPDYLTLWDGVLSRLLALHQSDTASLIELSPEALVLFREFAAVAEQDMQPDGRFGLARDWGGKFPGHVLRLAAALHCMDWALDAHYGVADTPGHPADRALTAVMMQAAIGIGEYYAAHAMAAYTIMQGQPDDDDAMRLWGKIQAWGKPRFTTRELQNYLRSAIRAERIKSLLLALERANYLRPARDGRKLAYEVNPDAQ